MQKSTLRLIALLLVSYSFLSSCDDNGDFVIFGIENDKQLGEQVADQIENDPQFNLMSRSEYPEAYQYIDNMFNDILASDELTFREEFDWEITLIDENVLNAFATPGGKIYIYTGLINFLDKEDDLAGVIGHEIAHADLRHSSKQLQASQGISVLLGIALGNQPESVQGIANLLANLGALKFGRDDEAEADEFSVKYLSHTQYACNGAAAFFEKLSDQPQQPEFLSTHPSPVNRVENINDQAIELGCSTTAGNEAITNYEAFKALLP